MSSGWDEVRPTNALAREASICLRVRGARWGGSLDENPRDSGKTGDPESGGVKAAECDCLGVAIGLLASDARRPLEEEGLEQVSSPSSTTVSHTARPSLHLSAK